MLTFLHRYGSIDELLPARVDEPSLHACYHLVQALRVAAHDLIKLCKLSRSEEDFGDSKSEVLVLHSDGTEQGPAERPGIQSGQFLGQAGLVPAHTHTHSHQITLLCTAKQADTYCTCVLSRVQSVVSSNPTRGSSFGT